MLPLTAPALGTPMTDDERAAFDRDGYLVVRGALSAAEVDRYRAAVDDAYLRSPEGANGVALHQLSAVTHCPSLAGLLDHPAVFRFVWSLLGWNVHVYHSHFDVHPPLRERRPFWWHWHQDGGRQNRELETDPRPRMSVKLAYWLSDVSVPGRGNLVVVPGSHRTNWLPGPPRRDQQHPRPAGAVELTVAPGDVLLFDRRLWHARSDNHSDITRKVVFVGYTYRWVHVRDEVAGLPGLDWFADLNPVRRQLLGYAGDGSGDHQWGLLPETTPLYSALSAAGLLTGDHPPLIP
jgi:ectoine hydroxylase-related dioxygenase (phytanoyl-CoA dioxygenase family)